VYKIVKLLIFTHLNLKHMIIAIIMITTTKEDTAPMTIEIKSILWLFLSEKFLIIGIDDDVVVVVAAVAVVVVVVAVVGPFQTNGSVKERLICKVS